MCDDCTSEADVVDAGRERIYEFLAAILTNPDAGTWGRVTDPEEQRRDVATVDALRAAAASRDVGLENGDATSSDLDLRALVVELCQPLGHLKADCDRFFVRARRNSHSPLEMDHKTAWLKRRPERAVEELNREYEDAACPEHENLPTRPDHASRELEFMAWLIAQARFQRRMACLGAASPEAVRSCDLAQRHFFGHHLAGWLPELAAQLREFAGGGCLEQLGRFLAAWIATERRCLDVEPRFAEADESMQTTETAPESTRSRQVVCA
ncbi:molecular chaperone TorD family protein [Paludisphaera mucosa]|uniref:Molecular chaperone TorD family protein n=1 Tax=Paludisphaera mucosa TaxID=3030827 RepID=A0ABT6F447_9BACT|nr:molecular chaperone TorD family protein [Paludisphaera mucosa]MDG3002363.1 molecular chaperone TorD family protein [Paludisphaera mucosa]